MSVLLLREMSPAFSARFPQRGPAAKPSCTRMEKPLISVVIPAYNEARFIADTIHSVLDAKKKHDGPVELIVVDNNSSDNTGEIAAALGATVVFEPLNQIARARNAGAMAAAGDYLVFLDADTRLEGDIFDKVEANLSSGRVIGGGAWAEPDADWFGRLIFKYAINYVLALKNVTVGPFLYCDKAAFHRVGGFDETLYAAEEFSLARRLKAEGNKQHKTWRIIRHHKGHRVITSSRKLGRCGCLKMAFQNAHFIWKPRQKFRQKDQCQFWYGGR